MAHLNRAGAIPRFLARHEERSARLLQPFKDRVNPRRHDLKIDAAKISLKILPYFLTTTDMLAKMTSKNQLTLPKQALDALGAVSYFEVEVDGGRLVLTPARLGAPSALRRKLAELDLTEADIADAVAWARQPR